MDEGNILSGQWYGSGCSICFSVLCRDKGTMSIEIRFSVTRHARSFHWKISIKIVPRLFILDVLRSWQYHIWSLVYFWSCWCMCPYYRLTPQFWFLSRRFHFDFPFKIEHPPNPPFAATILFELYKSNDDYYVQLFYRSSDDEILYPLNMPKCGTKCPLKKFFKVYEEVIPTGDYETECLYTEYE